MKILSFDAETNGLYGQAFCLAAVVTDENGLMAEFVGRCPIEEPVDDWVRDNVLPHIEDVEISHASYCDLLEAFYRFYKEQKDGATVVAHMAHPVETKVLRDMVEADLNGRMWDGPYPGICDVWTALELAGYAKPDSVDSYIKDHGLGVPFTGATHHPLYDSWAAEVVFRHLTKTVFSGK